jgi:hypothetical protein
VERLGDALADAGPGPGDDYHGIAEIEVGYAGCLSCHRLTSSQAVDETPLASQRSSPWR